MRRNIHNPPMPPFQRTIPHLEAELLQHNLADIRRQLQTIQTQLLQTERMIAAMTAPTTEEGTHHHDQQRDTFQPNPAAKLAPHP